jgi:dihydrodipicolinate synthase/N-acetylneuraminate lyase
LALEDAILKIVEWLIAQGWAGLVVLGQLGIIVLLIRDRKTTQTENKELRTSLMEIQEKRIIEGRESLATVAANTRGLDNLAQLISLSTMARR